MIQIETALFDQIGAKQTEPSKPQSVLQLVAADCAKKLHSIGAGFKIIVDGMEFGELEIVRPRLRAKKTYRLPVGARAKIYKPKIEGIEVGKVARWTPAEYEGFESLDMFNAITSAMSTRFGRGNYKVAMLENGVIEAVRLA